ncbi:hypothetical protein MMC13_002483 [Lambiella insularis]|nr:hypothetical protein [Lambiella insularis]
MSPPRPEIIVYSYDWAPNPQKLFQFLSLFAIPYKCVELPPTMPRPQLAAIGITYRRTPLLSIGSDMYVGNARIIAKLADIAQHSSTGLSDPTKHPEYDALGQLAFQLAAALPPPDTAMLQDPPSSPTAPTCTMLSLAQLVQPHFLRDGRRFFLGGGTPSTADLHLHWGLQTHSGAKPEISASSHPALFAWLDAVAQFLAPRRVETRIAMEEAYEVLRVPPTHEYAKFVPHVRDNPEGLSEGQMVEVTPTDSGRSGPQGGGC